jgi:ubiquinone/menaquinone biosynthesis C-methylase UbiE
MDAVIPADLLRLLRSPLDGAELVQDGQELVAGAQRFAVTPTGIPIFAEVFSSPEAKVQQLHYDRVAGEYLENLTYPHTQVYMQYLDDALLAAVDANALGTVAEICCGSGEAIKLLGHRAGTMVGIDISLNMLQAGRRQSFAKNVHFVQGDATRLPLADAALDSVFMLGGIHHVSDRRALFGEIFRILRPGGQFYFREPLNDFFLWQGLRAIIYRLSPNLDHATERPVRWAETVPLLRALGFECRLWRPLGLFGFCLFMNSDVLVFNRLFRFIPGIRGIVRASARLDDTLLRLPALRRAGLQVVGLAVKPS